MILIGMGRRSINGHSRRRRNKKASALPMTEAGSSPLKGRFKDKNDFNLATALLGPTAVIAQQRNQRRKNIEEESGREFKGIGRNARAKWYGKNMDPDGNSAWESQMDEMQNLSRVIPPTVDL